MMGPEAYGRYAILLSFIALLTIFSGLGMLPAFGRFVPQYQINGETDKTKLLFTQIFYVRLFVALIMGAVFLIVFPRLLPGSSSFTLLVGFGVVVVSIPASVFYQFLHGLNQLGKWLVQDSLLKLLLFLAILALGGLNSFPRAALALFLVQVFFFGLGIFWVRAYFSFGKSLLDFSFLYKHLRFGLLFFSANLLLTAVWRAGEVVVATLSGDTAEVAFFNIANLVAITVAAAVSQLVIMLTPSLTTLYVSNQEEEINRWLGFSLKYLTILMFAFLLGVYTFGQWGVQLIWGPEFLPVLGNMKVLALGLLGIPLIRIGLTLAIVYNQPGKVARITSTALFTFLVISAVLVARTGSLGAAVAVTAALISAAVVTYQQFPIGDALVIARFWRHLIFSAIVFAILLLPVFSPLILGLSAAVLYILLLFIGQIISIHELQQLIQLITKR